MIDAAVIDEEPNHELRDDLACLFWQHSPQRHRLIASRRGRQTE
jgi:hypothetical protein